MKRIAAIFPVFMVLTITGCTDPFVVIPGGQLSGNASPVPDDWGVVPEVVQLELRPADPYSINIWALEDNGNLYVATRNANWTAYVEADQRVRVRIDNQIYDLLATEVTDLEELGSVTEAYIRKYDIDGTESFVDDGQVYRLTPR